MLKIKLVKALANVSGDKSKEQFASNFGNQAAQYYRRYLDSGNLKDLNKAIAAAWQCAQLTPESQTELKFGAWHNLSNQLRRRYDQTGNLKDLDDAIKCAKEATARATGEGVQTQAMLLNSQANKLTRRYERTLNVADLEEGIYWTRFAIETTDLNHIWNNGDLSSELPKSYAASASSNPSTDSASSGSGINSWNLLPPELRTAEDPNLRQYLHNLASRIYLRYLLTGKIKHLNEAIRASKKSVSSTPEEARLVLPLWKSRLGTYLCARYRLTGNREDLDRAVEHCREAWLLLLENTSSMPDIGPIPERMLVPLALSECLEGLYDCTRDRKDLESARLMATRAVNWTPPKHIHHVRCLSNLGRIYARDYKENGSKDEDKFAYAHNSLREAWIAAGDLPLECGRVAAQLLPLLAEKRMFEDAANLAKRAIDLFPNFSSRSLHQADRQYVMSIFAGVSANCCSFLLEVNQPEEALHYLEKSRGFILGQIMDDTSEIDELRESYPTHAAKFEKYRNEVNIPDFDLDYNEPQQDRINKREKQDKACKDLEKRIQEIRKLPEHTNFLLGQSSEEMRACAEEGIIVIVNITEYRSDAILVSSTAITTIPLTNMTGLDTKKWLAQKWSGKRQDRSKANEAYLEMLAWLWHVCVQPISQLIPASDKLPRLWWIGSGLASSLPFHAAGIYTDDKENTVVHRTVSSYIPSIRELTNSRQRIRDAEQAVKNQLLVTDEAETPEVPTAPATPEPLNQLLIATMPTTPGLADLSGTLREKEAVKQRTDEFLPSIRELQETSAAEVLEVLKTSNFAHFACHGVVNADRPSESGLVFQREKEGRDGEAGTLKQDVLTFKAVSALKLRNAHIAYLSACSTEENQAVSLHDQVIPVAAGFQVAGFGHVIGCLWPTVDRVCELIAAEFYTALFHNGIDGWKGKGEVANALRLAVMKSWDMDRKQPLNWAQYVHYGV
jgi:CHAT domain-containing protein